jgi:protocatechuate 3,4-dioxygenase, alpha subunit
MGAAGPTPSQTVGPFFACGLSWMDGRDLVAPGAPGAVSLVGRVLDGDGAGVPDALVEIWQADASGRFGEESGAGWTGFGRCPTDDDGGYRFTTVKPAPVDGDQAPHIDVSVFARGLLQRLVTRVYFPDEERANRTDPVLASVDGQARRTLVATAEGDVLRFDIHLQGDAETVFFEY